jgi:hypothetical protein
MGYRKIPNLYRDIRILDFKKCFALEKIHGTSAHISFRIENDAPHFFSGGEKHENFVALFDQDKLMAAFKGGPIMHESVTIFGEAYGGKQQGMRETYGDKLKFIAFEVNAGGVWLPADVARMVADMYDIEFVDYEIGPATIEWLNEQRDRPSVQAVRNGILESKKREGIVIRPLSEYLDYRGNRIITKHKADDFRETKTRREIGMSPEKLRVLKEANAIADEWVTHMRLMHVLDKMPEKGELKHIPLVIKAMQEDIESESSGEIEWSKEANKAIGNATVKLYKNHISKI